MLLLCLSCVLVRAKFVALAPSKESDGSHWERHRLTGAFQTESPPKAIVESSAPCSRFKAIQALFLARLRTR